MLHTITQESSQKSSKNSEKNSHEKNVPPAKTSVANFSATLCNSPVRCALNMATLKRSSEGMWVGWDG